MRTRCRSRRFCRIVSCTAAKGMRWVKPSKATVSPSRILAATASASDETMDMPLTLCGSGLSYSILPERRERLLRRCLLPGMLAQRHFLEEEEADRRQHGNEAGRHEEGR